MKTLLKTTSITLILLITTNNSFGQTQKTTETKDNTSEKTIKYPSLKDIDFLSKKELYHFYQTLVNEINSYDAEARETRNNNKKISWETYVKHHKKKLTSSQNWQQLADHFQSFSDGFVNLHSRLSFNPDFDAPSISSNIKIGYTYPEVSFFIDDEQKQNIKKINGKPINKVFNRYEQFSCRYNSTIGCLGSFVRSFYLGKLRIKNEKPQYLTLANEKININYTPYESEDPMEEYLAAIDVSSYDGWSIIEQGYKVAILKKEQTVLIKIKDFIYTQGTGGGLRCEEDASEKSLCYDVRLIRQALAQLDTTSTNLIIDVQNNGGGNENSPFLAELSLKPFEDLRVRYRNTDQLNDENMRQYLFYGSTRAESWFQQTIKDLSQFKEDFLPMRSDFCRGDELCAIKAIAPNKIRPFKNVIILTNHECVSSCDDFVWRMQKYSHVDIIGLPNAADATYSRISILFYLDENRKIQKIYYGDGGQPKYKGTELFSMIIPYSKTVDENGQLKQGVAADLKHVVDVTKNNYRNHDMAVLKKAMTLLK